MELFNTTTVFEENQVLTANQLNTMQDFLLQESRLTRTRLIGRGIAYGLEAKVDTEKVNISKGVGVTSWGFLISLGDCQLGFYKDYVLPDGLIYPYFNGLDGKQVPLIELVSAERAANAGAKPFDAGLILSNYVVVLFLEPATKNLQSCLGKSCDDIGIEKTFTVRKLLISIDQLNYINFANQNVGGSLYPGIYNLKTIDLPRAVVSADNLATYASLINSYLSPVASVIDQLTEQLELIYQSFPILKAEFYAVDFESIKASWHEKLLDLSSQYLNGVSYGFQYLYDAFEDIIKSYEALRCAIMHLNSSVLPQEDAFPLHLMLGSVSCPPAYNRQEFEYAPLFNDNKAWNKKVTTIFGRTLEMINGFFDYLSNKTQKSALVTPSNEKWQSIGKRALPIYFKPTQQMLKFWNESLCHGCNDEKPLSYHFQLPIEAQEYGLAKTEAPLYYNFNESTFLRAEGHLGLPQETALKQYKAIQRKFNLPFKVRTVFIGEGNDTKMDCSYPDLDFQYGNWKNSMLFYLNNIIKYSNLAERMTGNFDDLAKAIEDAFNNISGIKTEAQPATEAPKTAPSTTTKPDVAFERMRLFSDVNRGFIKMGALSENINRTNYGRITDTKITAVQAKDEVQRDVLNWMAKFNNAIEDLIASITLSFSDFKDNDFKARYNAFTTIYIDGMKTLVKIINQEKDKDLLSYLMMAGLAHRVINTLLIRPYLTIGTLLDIRKQRNAALRMNKSLSQYLNDGIAVNHLAGVESGNTLLLLYHTGKENKAGDVKPSLPVKSKSAILEELKVSEKTIHEMYKAKIASLEEIINARKEEIQVAERDLKKALDVQIAGVKNRIVLNDDQVKRAELELQKELLNKKKLLVRTVLSENLAKAEEDINKAYNEKILMLRKSAVKNEASEIKEVSKNLQSNFDEKVRAVTIEVDRSSLEKIELQKEYQQRLDLIEFKRNQASAAADEATDVNQEILKTKFYNVSDEKFQKKFAELVQKIGTTGIKNLGTNVIADFTIYEDDSCCECNPKNVANRPLTPLAMDQARVVAYNRLKTTTSKIQVLNNLYDPAAFEITLKSEARFGTLTFEEEAYEPAPSAKRQLLVYTLDPDKVDRRALSQMVAIDEVEYGIRERKTDIEVGTAKISFFITIGSVNTTTYEVYGQVTGAKSYAVTVRQAKNVVKSQQFAGANFTLTLEAGDYEVTVAPTIATIPPQSQKVTIGENENVLNFAFGKV
ncbi:synaptonemal complex protein 1 [Pedobacter sandarakinus]|uniref:hypothetical protein n=1 Tax=Pedobacter sandarakinus TaxID=353156 RepID=UPI002247E662|nr:hypothetical protein [Pedobacter sandarakinus]MCX2574535.1 hypothetical protein [Pedobacter sandarakinus]